MGIICVIAGIAASLETKFDLALMYFLVGPLLIVGAHLMFPEENDHLLEDQHPDHDEDMCYAMHGEPEETMWLNKE